MMGVTRIPWPVVIFLGGLTLFVILRCMAVERGSSEASSDSGVGRELTGDREHRGDLSRECDRIRRAVRLPEQLRHCERARNLSAKQ